MARLRPGFAFAVETDLGFSPCLVTHQVPRMGDVIWVAGPVFDTLPSPVELSRIAQWRWPTLFPTGAAVRRKLVIQIGLVEVPAGLTPFPRFRSGHRSRGWHEVDYSGGAERTVGVCRDPDLPIFGIVNDTLLKERIVTGWRPSREF